MTARTDWHQENFEKLPKEIADKSIQFLKSFLSDDDVVAIKQEFEKDPNTWWAAAHFSWGMGIRNQLRNNVCLDKDLPTYNWDDYYVILVEKACGLR